MTTPELRALLPARDTRPNCANALASRASVEGPWPFFHVTFKLRRATGLELEAALLAAFTVDQWPLALVTMSLFLGDAHGNVNNCAAHFWRLMASVRSGFCSSLLNSTGASTWANCCSVRPVVPLRSQTFDRCAQRSPRPLCAVLSNLSKIKD